MSTNPRTNGLDPAAIPAPLHASALMRAGGYRVVDQLIEPSYHRQLLTEATRCGRQAVDSRVEVSDGEEIRGGQPRRQLLSAPGGPLQRALYHSPGLLQYLADVTGMALAPTGEGATYSYYLRPGDHLALHRDILTCDLTVISCLLDHGPAEGEGGRLGVYPERLWEPLSAIRREPGKGRRTLRLAAGQSLVLLGGIVPHAVLPVVPGQRRITSLLCFRLYS